MVSISRNRALASDTEKDKPRKPEKPKKIVGRAYAKKQQGEKKTRKRKGGKTNFVLFVGDEGAILTHVSGLTVLRRLYAPSPDQVDNLRQLLDSDPKAPIHLLLDSMDQAYQRHTLPPVASVSLNKIVRRRLARDFAADDIKGALQIGREESGRKDWNYLLVAVSAGGAVSQWMDLCLDRDNPFKGIYLSPVESESFISRLSKPLGKPTTEATEIKARKSKDEWTYPWQLLVSHHKVGGFRLVVLYKGRLAFTRLAQPIGDSTPEVVAGNVEQEVLNTVEYMKRLGYQDGQQLQVLVVVAPDIKQSLDRKNIPAQDVHFFSPFEAAGLLGLDSVAQPEDHYADVLQSVHLLAAKKHRLILHNPATGKLSALAGATTGAYVAAALLGIGLIGYGGYQFWQGMQMGEEIAQLEVQLNGERQSAQRAEEEMKKFPETIQSMLDVTRLYIAYASKQTYLLTTSLSRMNGLQEKDFQPADVKWTRVLPSGTTPESLLLLMKGELRKTPQDTVTTLRERLNTLLDEARRQFSDGTVAYAELPEVFSEKSELRTTIGGDAENDALQRVLSQPLKVTIRVEAPPKATGATP